MSTIMFERGRGTVLVGDVVLDGVEGLDYREVETPHLQQAVDSDPVLMEELKLMLLAAHGCGSACADYYATYYADAPQGESAQEVYCPHCNGPCREC